VLAICLGKFLRLAEAVLSLLAVGLVAGDLEGLVDWTSTRSDGHC
jgi:hypothetical protein